MTATTESKPTRRPVQPITRPAADELAKRTRSIDGNLASLAQFKRNMWSVIVPDDMPTEDLEKPETWLHAGRQWLMHDRVECISSRRWVEGIVVDIGPGTANIKLLQSIELPPKVFGQEQKLPAGYAIRQGGPSEGPYVIVREKDNWVMNQYHRCNSFEEARRHLLDMAIFKSK
jgi:hypothetical protein